MVAYVTRMWNWRAVLLITSFLLTGCTVSGVDVEQERASGLAGELLDGHSFGQTFAPQYDGLYRIDLYTATYARDNTHPVIFRVCPAPACGSGEEADLARLEIPSAEISNSGPTVITFPPLAGTAGQTLYFSIESPGSVLGDAITIYRNETDVYPGGQMVVDGQPTQGDVAFIAYTKETFTLADVWNDFTSRASQDRPFFTFYGALLALLLAATVAALVWPSRRSAADTRDAQSDPIAEKET